MHETHRVTASAYRLLLLVGVSILIASCASSRVEESQTAVPKPPSKVPATPAEVTELPAAEPAPGDRREEIVERGSGVFLGPAPRRPAVVTEEGDINLRFEDADIGEFVGVVLGDLLGVNYVIDPDVSGTVTVSTSTPVTEEQLLPLFEEILEIHDVALLHSPGLYRVVPRTAVSALSPPLSVANGALAPGFVTQIIPLRFIAAQEMQRILEGVVADPNSIRIEPARNIVIASGTAPEIQVVRDTIDIFDVDWLRGMSVGLYPLDNVDPGTLEMELSEVLAATAGSDAGDVLGGIVRLVPLERLTSLLVVSSTPSALREVEVWIRRLDRAGESTDRRLYVYHIQNAKALELAEILGTIFRSQASVSQSTSATEPATPRPLQGTVAPGLTPTRIGPGATPPGPASANAAAPPSASTGGNAIDSTSGAGLNVEGGASIEIIADDIRNALVILATPQDYRMVESAIRELDVVPLQVLIEASILEVTLRDDLSLGVEWFFRNSVSGGSDNGTGTLDLASAGITALAPGFSYTVINNASQIRFALNTLASESEVNVLSSPSLMVLDNQTATINVGDEIPVPTRQSISNIDPASPTVNEVSFRQTGVTLSVTPRVNNSGLVTMDIRQEVATAVTTTTSNIDAPTIQNRQIESVVAINSGDTIVLGGLIQDQQSEGQSGLPGLYRVPVLRRLFGRTTNEFARTELLVLITPRVVRNQQDAREVTDEMRRKLPQLRSLTPASAAPASAAAPAAGEGESESEPQ